MALRPLSPQARSFRAIPLLETTRREPIVPVYGRQPRVHLWHIGCQMNEADREDLRERFAEIGCVPDVPLADADLAVLITCTVRQNAEQKVYGKFKELIPWKQERAGRAIAMTGCMAVEHGEQLLSQMPDLDYLFDVRESDGFFAKIQQLYHGDLDGPVPLPASDALTSYVSVMGGCNEMCTYCIVPFVRGRESSRTVADIVGQCGRQVALGVKEITLLGQNVNSYEDPESGARLWDLMAEVDAIPGLERLRFLTSHPRNATTALFTAMRNLPSACEQLHLPIQAGHDDLLKRMRRVYTVAEYKERIAEARDIIPNLALSTDIIVGFSGETEEEFEGTLDLLREVRFDVVHIQAYSVRPGTAAARREDDIPLALKKERLATTLSLQKEIARELNGELVGKRLEILVEGKGEEGAWYGRSRQNKVVWLDRGTETFAGATVDATVTATNCWQLYASVT